MQIDRERFSQTYKDDRQLANDLACLFLERIPENLAILESATQSRDQSKLIEIAHRIKSHFGYFAAPYLTSIVCQLECCGRDGDFTKASQHLINFRVALHEFIEELHLCTFQENDQTAMSLR